MSSKPEYEKISVDKLILDDQNPRLPKSMHGSTENEIIEWMLLEASTLELMQAIGENDFFEAEQLLVVKEPKNDLYRVIEGNRRLVSVKLLQDPKKTSVKNSKVNQVYSEAEFYPTEIPCLVFIEKKEILKYLGFRHITGIKTWKLLAKARYLSELKLAKFPNIPISQSSRDLAKMIGSRRDYVERLLIGFEIYQIIENEDFFSIPKLEEQTFHLNYCLLYTSPSPRDLSTSRMPSSA